MLPAGTGAASPGTARALRRQEQKQLLSKKRQAAEGTSRRASKYKQHDILSRPPWRGGGAGQLKQARSRKGVNVQDNGKWGLNAFPSVYTTHCFVAHESFLEFCFIALRVVIQVAKCVPDCRPPRVRNPVHSFASLNPWPLWFSGRPAPGNRPKKRRRRGEVTGAVQDRLELVAAPFPH